MSERSESNLNVPCTFPSKSLEAPFRKHFFKKTVVTILKKISRPSQQRKRLFSTPSAAIILFGQKKKKTLTTKKNGVKLTRVQESVMLIWMGWVSIYTSLSISFSTYSTVRTRFSPVCSSMYSSVFLVIVSPRTFSLSRTVVLPGFIRTANLGKSALEGLNWTGHAMLLVAPTPWTRYRVQWVWVSRTVVPMRLWPTLLCYQPRFFCLQ